MQSVEKQPKAIDLAHHLSDVSRARETSALKGLAKYFGRPGLISLAGGTHLDSLRNVIINVEPCRDAKRGVLPFRLHFW